MTFDIEQPLDDHFLELIALIKTEIKIQPIIKWVKDKNTLLVILTDYISEPVNISYYPLEMNKYKVFTSGNIIGSFNNIREAVNATRLLYFLEKGVSVKIIEYLASNSRFSKMEKFIDKLPDTDLLVTSTEMEILNINRKHRGKIHAKGFGV